jgi:hypothetical protein
MAHLTAGQNVHFFYQGRIWVGFLDTGCKIGARLDRMIEMECHD